VGGSEDVKGMFYSNMIVGNKLLQRIIHRIAPELILSRNTATFYLFYIYVTTTFTIEHRNLSSTVQSRTENGNVET